VDERQSVGERAVGTEPLYVVDRPLGWALGRVLAQFQEAEKRPLTYVVEGNAVRIGSPEYLDDPDEVKVYDVGEFLRPMAGRTINQYGYVGRFPMDGREFAGEQLVAMTMDTISPPVWTVNGGRPATFASVWGDWMVVSAPAQAQRGVARLLFLLRHPVPPGIGLETGVGR
jgi:hypothetical protein